MNQFGSMHATTLVKKLLLGSSPKDSSPKTRVVTPDDMKEFESYTRKPQNIFAQSLLSE